MSKEIPLNQGRITIVDDEDYEFLSQWKWFCDKDGYAVRRSERKNNVPMVRMHRLIMSAEKGKLVDHCNRDKLDNRKENLRIANSRQNNANIDKTDKDCSSEYKGVFYMAKKNFWIASIRTKSEGKREIGYFSDEISAANAYNFYAEKEFGEFSLKNNVPFMSEDEWRKNDIRKTFSSEYKYITFHKAAKKWAFQYQKGEKVLEFFETEDEAVYFRNSYLEEKGVKIKERRKRM